MLLHNQVLLLLLLLLLLHLLNLLLLLLLLLHKLLHLLGLLLCLGQGQLLLCLLWARHAGGSCSLHRTHSQQGLTPLHCS